jgi:hypothetical protein
MVNEPVDSFYPVIVPFSVSAVKLKDHVFTQPSSRSGIVRRPDSIGLTSKIGVLANEKFDPSFVHSIRECLGLCDVLGIVTAKRIGRVTVTVEVIEDKSDLLSLLVTIDRVYNMLIYTSWKCVDPISVFPNTCTSKRYE